MKKVQNFVFDGKFEYDEDDANSAAIQGYWQGFYEPKIYKKIKNFPDYSEYQYTEEDALMDSQKYYEGLVENGERSYPEEDYYDDEYEWSKNNKFEIYRDDYLEPGEADYYFDNLDENRVPDGWFPEGWFSEDGDFD